MASITRGSLSGGYYAYTVTVNVKNNNLSYAVCGFSVALQSSATIIGPSAAVSIASLATNTTTTATFTFSANTPDILSGVFQLVDCAGNNDGSPISLVLATAAWSLSLSGTACSGVTAMLPHNCTITVNNAGVLPITSVTCVVTGFGQVLFGGAGVSNNCASTLSASSVSITTGSIAPGASATLLFGAVRTGGFNFQNLTVTSNDGTINVPPLAGGLNLF